MGLVRECYQLSKSFCLFGYFSKGVLLQQVNVTIDLKVTNNNFFLIWHSISICLYSCSNMIGNPSNDALAEAKSKGEKPITKINVFHQITLSNIKVRCSYNTKKI